MSPWSRVHGSDVGVFTRPLGTNESGFYWDTVFSGTSDSLQQVTVHVPAAEDSRIFSAQNIKRTWITLKALHPLLGASVREHENASGASLVVDAARLAAVGPDENIFRSLQSDEEACDLADRILNEPRLLSNELLGQIWIISFPQENPMHSIQHQVFFHLAHYISDGMAQNAIIKAFFDILVHTEAPDMYVPKDILEARLALVPAVEDAYPARKYSLPRQRWRLAIAQVIYSSREARLRGCHTLPRTVTPQKPAVSRTLRLKLSKDLTRRIIASCRRAQITFGVTLPILCQLAHARVLHRLRAQGSISEAEWAYRITQPMYMGGPLNLRPYLDQAWLKSGGEGRVCLAISHFLNILPSMPVSQSSGAPEESPSFGNLLSPSRFFHRCLGVKRQTSAIMKHPLFMEFTLVNRPGRIRRAKAAALDWRANPVVEELPSPAEDSLWAIPRQDEFCLSNACSSMGNMDNLLSPEYPLRRPSDDLSAPRLRITSLRHYLRCRPTELYLTSISYLQELQLVLFCDVRTYDEALVEEWLREVGQAAEWYLGAEGDETERIAARL